MIGVRIKRLREENGYSITKLARLARVSKSYLSQIEKGVQSNPSLQFLIKIAAPLNTSIEYLLDNETDQQDELDYEWRLLIQSAIANGLKKEDFREYLDYIRFQAWMNEKNET